MIKNFCFFFFVPFELSYMQCKQRNIFRGKPSIAFLSHLLPSNKCMFYLTFFFEVYRSQ